MSKDVIKNLILNVQKADDESQFEAILNFASEGTDVDHFYPFRFDTSNNLNNIHNWLNADIMDSTEPPVVIKLSDNLEKRNPTKFRKLRMKVPKPKSTDPIFNNIDDALLYLNLLKAPKQSNASKLSKASLENKENIAENNLDLMQFKPKISKVLKGMKMDLT